MKRRPRPNLSEPASGWVIDHHGLAKQIHTFSLELPIHLREIVDQKR